VALAACAAPAAKAAGAPRGIASTDPELMMQVGLEWATQRLINLHFAWREQMTDALARMGRRASANFAGAAMCCVT